jgi:(2R)-sulfolactate sulfo-lyase subunit alpha
MKPDIVIHDNTDSVGVAVVEGIEAGQELSVWIMDTNETKSIVANDAIPLGHKIAMVDLAEGDTLIKYGYDIGKVVEACATGHHVHVHNVKTKKW